MAGVNVPGVPDSRGGAAISEASQFAAIARVRWQIIVNSLRTMRGRLEIVSRVFVGLWFAVGGLGGAIALGFAAGYFVSQGHVEWIAFLLWGVLLFWQLFPIIATAFTESFDSSNLLRFPLTYRSFFIVRLVYGSLDPATAIGILWLLGLFIGITVADPRLFFAAAVVLLTFGAMNVLLARTIFAWLERWLAQRRTREIMGIVLFLLIIGVQFIGPLSVRFGNHQHAEAAQYGAALLPFERALPPGLAAVSIAQFSSGNFPFGLAAFLLLGVYAASFFWLLHVRVRAQFRGENLSEAAAAQSGSGKGRAKSRAEKLPVRAGWDIPFISGPTAAIFQKELTYLMRSGPMLFLMVMPVIVLLIFRMAPGRPGSNSFINSTPDFAFPIGAAYALLMLTNLVYNSFGADAAGVQFWFVSPARLREVVRAKNLVHAAILAGELVLVWIAANFMFRTPSLVYTAATVAAILFAAPLDLAVGNLLSIFSPKKIDFGTFGRQRANGTTVFTAFLVQGFVFGVIALAFIVGVHFHDLWITTAALLVLAAVAFAAYAITLRRIDTLALTRRESLITELSKA
jgi:ABC-2 type transport system permease protein